MARITRDSRIETREARRRLKARHEPYWRAIHPGLAIGYRKGERGAVWVARKLDGKTYLKKRLGTADDHADADGAEILSYKQAHDAAIKFGRSERVRARQSDPTVEDAIKTYIKQQRIHAKSADETENKAKARIIPALGKRKVAELTLSELRRWHSALAARKGHEPEEAKDLDPEALRKRKATANRLLTVLKAALNLAYSDGLVPTDEAWRRLKPFRNVEKAKIRYLTADEARRLINASDPDFRPLVQGALQTGMRYGELRKLRVQDYNPDAGTVTVAESKGGKPRHIPLTDEGRQLFDALTAGREAGEILFLRADGEPWGKAHQHRRIKAACGRAKIIPAISFHDLRNTYGSLLAMKGVPLQVIAQALGHADTRMTERHYAHLLPSYVADTIRANLPSFGAGEPAKVTRIAG